MLGIAISGVGVRAGPAEKARQWGLQTSGEEQVQRPWGPAGVVCWVGRGAACGPGEGGWWLKPER